MSVQPRRNARTTPRRIAAADARQRFSEILDDVRRSEEPIVIERAGVPVAAVVPLATLERERRWTEERTTRLELLGRLRAPFVGTPVAELEREARAAVSAVRKERRRKAARRR